MKRKICFLILTALAAWQVFADSTEIKAWGPTTNQLQMNLRIGPARPARHEIGQSATNHFRIDPQIRGGITEIKANADYTLFLQVKNDSTNQAFFSLISVSLNTDPFFGVECVVVSPSGRVVSPHVKPLGVGSNFSVSCGPNQTKEFEFNLGAICKLNKIGIYKITAKKQFYQDKTNQPVVISNTFYVKVVPDE